MWWPDIFGRDGIGLPDRFNAIIIAYIIAFFVAELVLNQIPHGAVERACNETRGFTGEVKSITCGYQQYFGVPFRSKVSFEESESLVAVDSPNVKNVYRRFSPNALFLFVTVACPIFLLKHIYLSRELERSKNIIR